METSSIPNSSTTMGWVRDILNTFVITDGDFADYDGIEDFFNTVMAGVCVMCAGLAAGLTMGLLSLDVTKLEIKCRVGTDEEKSDAALVLPIVKKHHLLLVTLLLFNSIANETLPIFLGELVPNYLAILLAVFLILIFGEILPSAFFTGVHQLRTSARLVPVVYCLIAVLYPVAYPISKALDRIFGEDEDEGAMTRSELEALVLMQQAHTFRLNTDRPVPESAVKKKPTGPSLVRENSILPPLDTSYGSLNETTVLLNDLEAGDVAESDQDQTVESSHRDGLSAGEVTLMLGVLNLAKQTVGCAMIAMEKVFMVSSSNRLDDRAFLQGVLRSGFSRVPVFYRDNNHHILGYMLVKELILTEKDVRLEDVKLREPLFVKPEVGLLEMLGIFQEGQCHMAIVTADPATTVQHLRAGHPPPHAARVLGLVTLEDVLEKVLQGDITDETDAFGDYDSPHKGVMTTTMVRKINRVQSVKDLYTDNGSGGSAAEHRRARSISRGRTSSRANLSTLSSLNVIAGDVRHKERDSSSPMQASRRSSNRLSVEVDISPRSDLSLGRLSNSTPAHHEDFFSDVVDKHVVEVEIETDKEDTNTQSDAAGPPAASSGAARQESFQEDGVSPVRSPATGRERVRTASRSSVTDSPGAPSARARRVDSGSRGSPAASPSSNLARKYSTSKK